MERLEGKYFENTIAALKNLKNAESFELNPSFKAKLRAELMAGTDLLAENTEESGLLELVSRFKYVFGAVPMLAVFVLVFAQFSNWQVKVPTEQIKPDEIKSNVLTNKDPVQVMEMKQPSIQAFPAESVMPPREVLDRMWSDQTKTVDAQSQARTVEQQDVTDTVKQPQLKIKDPQIEVSGSDILKENSRFVMPIDETSPVENHTDNTNLYNNSLQNTVSAEQQGRVEDSGKVVESSAPALMMDKTVLVENPTITTNSMNIVVNSKVAPVSADTVTQKEATTQMTETTSLKTIMVIPVSLSDDKVTYQAENRKQVVSAVLKTFADRNGNLSNDYTINVAMREDGSYKAVLFELGRATKVVTFTYMDDKLVVLTELNY